MSSHKFRIYQEKEKEKGSIKYIIYFIIKYMNHSIKAITKKWSLNKYQIIIV